MLHEAARTYDAPRLGYLLGKGYDPNAKNEDGQSPLHVLLKDGFRGHLNKWKMEECLRILIENNCDVNGQDGSSGEYPLTLAVHYKFQHAALLLVRNGADTTVRTKMFPGPHSLASQIGKTMPEVMMEILNSGVILEDNSKSWEKDEADQVKLDWRPILQYCAEDGGGPTTPKKYRLTRDIQRETSFLHSLLDVPPSIRSQYLRHPLISAFLFLRYQKSRNALYLFQGLMALFTISYMTFIYFLYFNHCKFEGSLTGNSSSSGNETVTGNSSRVSAARCQMPLGVKVCSYLLSLVVAGFVVVEIYLLIQIKFKHMNSWRSWILRATIFTMALTLWPGVRFKSSYRLSWQYPIAALATFFAWIMFFLQVELIPRVKVYTEMLATVVVSVLKIILLFLPLLIGFYTGFHLMFSDIGGFMNFVLMTVDFGSDEYKLVIANARDPVAWFRAIANGFNVLFIIVIQIVFMNFMLGVSFNDIQELTHNARIMSLSHKLEFVFIINLIFPYHYNVLTTEDIEAEKWFYTYVPNENLKLTDQIRMDITQLLQAKHSPPQVERSGGSGAAVNEIAQIHSQV